MTVRKYVEGMKEPTQLLDLLAAVGSDNIEPTRVVAGRQAFYPDVCAQICFIPPLDFLTVSLVSFYSDGGSWC